MPAERQRLALVLLAVTAVRLRRRCAAAGAPGVGAGPAVAPLPFLGGLAVLAVATQTGSPATTTSLFSVHVVQHVLLGMVGAGASWPSARPSRWRCRPAARGDGARCAALLDHPVVRS